MVIRILNFNYGGVLISYYIYCFCSTGLEAFAQYSQLKSMMGELDLSLEYIEKALINVRSKDEVMKTCLMLYFF